MTRPSPSRLFQTLDATWPAAEFRHVGPWIVRAGKGGGQRVSAATAEAAVAADDVNLAEHAMRDLGQRPLFMIRSREEALDQNLAQLGYDVVDPVSVYLAPVTDVLADLPITKAFPSWPPLAAQLELWSDAGIGPSRIAVMERCKCPKTAFVGRSGDAPAGAAFVAIDQDLAMVHAIEVHPDMRRKGVGRALLQACADWSAAKGADWICLAVTRANVGANALYRSIGMVDAAQYHYRRAPEVPA